MKQKICLVPKLSGLGGMVSFQHKFISGLMERDIPYSFDITNPEITTILVIGGTRQLLKLWKAKKRGVRIVQRLNGMNWMHKVEKTPFRAALRAEINNHILAFIRRYLADSIVYQSKFSHVWWDRVFGSKAIPSRVTFNGVDLEKYTPTGPETPPDDHYRILLVEGHISGAYARGLETAIQLAQTVKSEHGLSIELMVVGEVSDPLMAHAHVMAPDLWITWRGVIPLNEIPAIDRAAHVLFSADLNAACPNSVIEALACGLPVVAFNTGALAELVQEGAGEVVPYGANHWELDPPIIPPLATACAKILQNNLIYRKSAREWALKSFSLNLMVDGYLQELVG